MKRWEFLALLALASVLRLFISDLWHIAIVLIGIVTAWGGIELGRFIDKIQEQVDAQNERIAALEDMSSNLVDESQ
jgi:hypothetical protein